MNVTSIKVTVGSVSKGYENKAEEGVHGYSGALNIRPAYQREYVYDDAKRDAVIRTIKLGFPLNSMHWSKNADGTFEVVDGQQRTISFCEYIAGAFSVDGLYFHSLPEDTKKKILDYPLMVYICEGEESERLDWFKIINISGEPLTQQELRNATYTGPWLSDAKRHFSKTNCPAYQIGRNYVTGVPVRQELLEKVLDWYTEGNIEEYMSKHQHDDNADELWQYYQDVLAWVRKIFPTYYREMKGLQWGRIYNAYSGNKYNSATLQKQIEALMVDDDVTKKSGIFEYLLSGDEKHLNIRAFLPGTIRSTYGKQDGKCAKCGNSFDISEMEADHITPWSRGGRTVPENCQMLCKNCNRTKSDT
jgi:hypothetical protein